MTNPMNNYEIMGRKVNVMTAANLSRSANKEKMKKILLAIQSEAKSGKYECTIPSEYNSSYVWNKLHKLGFHVHEAIYEDQGLWTVMWSDSDAETGSDEV